MEIEILRVRLARSDIVLMVQDLFISHFSTPLIGPANTTVSLDQSEAWKIGLRTIKTISFLADFILEGKIIKYKQFLRVLIFPFIGRVYEAN